MGVNIVLPSALAAITGGVRSMEVEAESVRGALAQVATRFPTAASRLLDDSGSIRRHINVFVGETNVRDLNGIDTPLKSDDDVIIIQAVSGG
jgi:molybdopterin converting factor small subunit